VSERTDSADASLLLHTALIDALEDRGPLRDYYALYPASDDGGYLAALVEECRLCVARLPSSGLVRAFAKDAASRCGHAQSFTHVAMHDDGRRLREWANQLSEREGLHEYHWWEIGAAGISSLTVHALFAAAAHDDSTPSEMAAIDAAYFPSVCALSTLFDSLIDAEDDNVTGNHSYVGHYEGAGYAGARLVSIVQEAVERLELLRDSRLHRTILAGVAAFYLSAAAARADAASVVTQQVLAALSPSVLPILWTLSLRRKVKLAAARLRPVRA
jgi:tetraprenyl-beta-curcumene synthase